MVEYGVVDAMTLHFDGRVEFSSKKDIVEYISLFHNIEYRRDVSSLEDAIGSTDILQEPFLEVDDNDNCITVCEGSLDEGSVIDVIEESKEVGDGSYCGIELTARIGEFTFHKYDRYARWECDQEAQFGMLPSGYSAEDLAEALLETCGAEDEDDLISAALDDAIDLEEAFTICYEMFRSKEDDIDTIEEKLGELGFDGFCAEEYEYMSVRNEKKIGHRVYGWKRDMELPYDGFPIDQKIDASQAARYLFESCM